MRNFSIYPGTSDSATRGRTSLLMLLVMLLFVSSCGPTTETVVVGERARAIENGDDEETIESEEEIRVLKAGEVNRIQSFDPLFALNTATKRTIMLTYEGLVRFDENDEIVPAAAARWEVSDDSLTYTFELRDDLYFHDDQSFAQGRGRRVNSNDVVRLFERMASRDVPPNAAEMFLDVIAGFEAYYLEQREIYFEHDREIREIDGIEAVDNNTIAFHLLETDQDFLARLASPYAVLYPFEPFRFREEGLHRRPVGTGPFQHESTIGDSLHIFLRNDSYHKANEQGQQLPRVHRLELLNITNETRLFTHFSRERLNMIMDLGPESVKTLLGSTNQLQEQMNDLYRLEVLDNPDPIILQYNAENRFGLGRADAAAVIRHVDQDILQSSLGYPSLEITYQETEFTQSNIGRTFQRFGVDQPYQLSFAYNQDVMPRILSESIYETIDSNLQVELMQRRVFSRDIMLYLDYLQTHFPGREPDQHPREILRIETDRYMIFDQSTNGVRTNSLGWWINLNHANVLEDAPL